MMSLRRAWASGVGFGTGQRGAGGPTWDASASAAAQAAHDSELQVHFLLLQDPMLNLLSHLNRARCACFII